MQNWRRALCVIAGLVSLAGTGLAQPLPQPDTPQASAEPGAASVGYPVRLAGTEVFRLYDPVDPEESVHIAEERLLRIARDPFYTPGLLTSLDGKEGVWILYRDSRLSFVSDEVAARFGTSAKRRAAEVIEAVEEAVEEYHRRQSPEEWARALVLIALATLLLAGSVYLLWWFHRRSVVWIESRSTSLKVGGRRLGFRSTARLVAFQLRLLRLLRAVLVAFLVIVYLQSTFTIVPLTRGYALSVIAYLVDPLRFLWQGLLKSVGDFFFIAVIVSLARMLLRGIRLLLTEAASGSLALPGIPRDRAEPLYKIVRLVVIAITIVMVYPYIPGSSTAAFQGVSLFAGALFTLGASSTASNFIGGMVLVFSSSFQIGDRVKIGSVVGDVEQSTLAFTRLRTSKNELVTFANGNVLNEAFVNYSAKAREEGLILHASLTIGYDVPWRRVHELLIGAGRRTQHVLDEPAPFVLQTSLNDDHVGYQINVYTREANRMATVKSELHQNIQDAFAEAGVEILSPTYAALRDGAGSTVPPEGAAGG